MLIQLEYIVMVNLETYNNWGLEDVNMRPIYPKVNSFRHVTFDFAFARSNDIQMFPNPDIQVHQRALHCGITAGGTNGQFKKRQVLLLLNKMYHQNRQPHLLDSTLKLIPRVVE